MKTLYATIPSYNAGQIGETKKICTLVHAEIKKALPKATSKIWHGSPVWFIDDNPVVGYSIQKKGVVVLFWSGQSFAHPGLEVEGSFKAAQAVYTTTHDVKVTHLRKWLRECKTVQWDYKNIVKKKANLVKFKLYTAYFFQRGAKRINQQKNFAFIGFIPSLTISS